MPDISDPAPTVGAYLMGGPVDGIVYDIPCPDGDDPPERILLPDGADAAVGEGHVYTQTASPDELGLWTYRHASGPQ